MKFLSIVLGLVLTQAALAGEGGIVTNNVNITNPPSWLTESRVMKVTQKIQDKLEWDINRVTVYFYSDQAAFEKTHGKGSAVDAYSRPSDNTVHLGPRVSIKNFDGIFGHELTHVIVAQKYHEAIPKWIEEGLANYIGEYGKVDYAWLKKQPEHDVTSLVHPWARGADWRYHYAASTAVMEMIASKCSLTDLLQLSVGSSLERKLDTYCEIPNINAAFGDWLKKKKK